MKKADFILIAIILLIGVGLFAGYRTFYQQAGSSVEILVDGKLYKTLSLSEEQSQEILPEDGGRNLLTIRNGYADMVEADCPDGLCVRQAKISHQGETLVCLPHKIVVKVTGDTDTGDDGLDGVAY